MPIAAGGIEKVIYQGRIACIAAAAAEQQQQSSSSSSSSISRRNGVKMFFEEFVEHGRSTSDKAQLARAQRMVNSLTKLSK